MILIVLFIIPNPFSSIGSGTNLIIWLLQPKTLSWVTLALRMRSKAINIICIVGPFHILLPLVCLPLNSTLQPCSLFSSSLTPPDPLSTTGFYVTWHSLLLFFAKQWLFILQVPAETKLPLTNLLWTVLWVRWPAVNSQTPCTFPPTNHTLL